jgi:thiamine pyrophosphokinase
VHLEGQPGDLVSLIPVSGPALGVTTTGLRWRLDGGGLAPGSTRGISNEMTDAEATVAIEDGTLLVVHGGTD